MTPSGPEDALICHCPCGSARLEIHGPPLFRILCHCSICQRFNRAPFSDVLVYDSEHVSLPAADVVQFDTYKPPPNVNRGRCARCGAPAVETVTLPLVPQLTMVPRAMYGSDAVLPPPAAHLFYDKRVADARDRLPRYRGFLPSQIAFFRYWLSAKRPRAPR